MKSMKTGHSEDFRLPFFNCRSSIQPEPIKSLLVRAMQEEISSGALAAPLVHGWVSYEAVLFQEREPLDSAPDEGLPIPIHKEGLLG
jgi:hypothetical protein